MTKRPTLNQTQMARACGISVRNFQNWGVQASATAGREKLYLVSDVIDNRLADQAARHQAALARLQDRIAELEAGHTEDGRTLDQVLFDQAVERTNLLAEQAEAQRMKNEVARHELAPFALITFILGQVANHIAGVLDSLPTELVRIASVASGDLDRVRSVTARAADRMVQLGDEEWIAKQFDTYLEQFDK